MTLGKLFSLWSACQAESYEDTLFWLRNSLRNSGIVSQGPPNAPEIFKLAAQSVQIKGVQ